MVTQASNKGWKAVDLPYDHGNKLFSAAQIFLVHIETAVHGEAAHYSIICER